MDKNANVVSLAGFREVKEEETFADKIDNIMSSFMEMQENCNLLVEETARAIYDGYAVHMQQVESINITFDDEGEARYEIKCR